MEKQRKMKIMSIVALLLAICALTLGYAAFSTTLNISSSASVSPKSSDFRIEFSDDVNPMGDEFVFLAPNCYNGAKADNNATLFSDSIDYVSAKFTQVGQYVEYHFYIGNFGKYDAYLKSINLNNLVGLNVAKKCLATTSDETKATDSLVQAACDGIELELKIDGETYNINHGDLAGVLLEKGNVVPIKLIIRYKEGSQLADGPFNATFGNISFTYSTVDNELITFTINDYVYQAIKGMTWDEWVQSEFNSRNFSIRSGDVFLEGEGYLYNYAVTSLIEASAEINDNEKYIIATSPIG
jgi:hypothetical protein